MQNTEYFNIIFIFVYLNIFRYHINIYLIYIIYNKNSGPKDVYILIPELVNMLTYMAKGPCRYDLVKDLEVG